MIKDFLGKNLEKNKKLSADANSEIKKTSIANSEIKKANADSSDIKKG